MSLEQALSENTAAIQSLVAVWSQLVTQGKIINNHVGAGEATAVTAGPLTIPVVKPPKPAKAVAPAVSATTPLAPAADSTPVATTAPAESPSSDAPSYEQVSEAIRAMVITDRANVVVTLAAFEAKKATELKPEQYADFLKALAS